KHPEYDHMTEAENKTLRSAADDPKDAAAQLAAGVLLEELGRYDMAAPFYHRILDGSGEGNVRADAHRGLAALARYVKEWEKLEKLIAIAENESAQKRLGLEADIATERAYRLLADKKYEDVRTALDKHIKANPESKRMGEMHFYAGVACFFLK